MSVLCVILGRAGSRGLPGKNALPVAGKPMIVHTIDAAAAARSVDRIVVSTDGAAIATAARAAGADVIDRPSELAGDTATVDAAARHAVSAAGGEPGVVVILYANVPVRPDGLIDRAVACLRETGADSVQSYAPVGKHHPFWMVTVEEDGRVRPNIPNRVYRRQDLPPLHLPDGGVIAVTTASLFTVDPEEPHAFLGHDRRGVLTEAGAVVDVDDERDLAVARAALDARAATAGR